MDSKGDHTGQLHLLPTEAVGPMGVAAGSGAAVVVVVDVAALVGLPAGDA